MTSLRARLTVALVAVVAVVLVALALALYVGVRDAAWQQHDAGLVSRAKALSAGAENEDEGIELILPRAARRVCRSMGSRWQARSHGRLD